MLASTVARAMRPTAAGGLRQGSLVNRARFSPAAPAQVRSREPKPYALDP